MSISLFRDSSKLPALKRPVVAAIGNFDGLHLGHQEILREVVRQCEFTRGGRGLAVLISFHPHPAVALGKTVELLSLASLRQRLEILSALGIDLLYLRYFSKQFSQLDAKDFVDQVLISALNVQCLIIGKDTAVGRGREGDANYLKAYLEGCGRSTVVLDFLKIDGQKVGSRHIREMIGGGEVKGAARLLGRHFSLEGVVKTGDRIGKSLGFPTANLGAIRQVLPAGGVYATRLSLRGRRCSAVTNIGIRPTFAGKGVSVETHLIGYGGPDFYGERVHIEFVERLRDERQFKDLEALKTQISKDVRAAEALLAC